MKLVSVGIDPDPIGPIATVPIRSQWAIGDIVMLTILLCDSRNETPGFLNNPTWKMKLVLVGIDPDYVELAVDHVSAELFDW